MLIHSFVQPISVAMEDSNSNIKRRLEDEQSSTDVVKRQKVNQSENKEDINDEFTKDCKCSICIETNIKFLNTSSNQWFIFNCEHPSRNMTDTKSIEQAIFFTLKTKHHSITLEEFKTRFPETDHIKLDCSCCALLAIAYNRADLLEIICSWTRLIGAFFQCFSLAMFLKRMECLQILDKHSTDYFDRSHYHMKINRSHYHMKINTAISFDIALAQRIFTRFPNCYGWNLVVQNLEKAFESLYMIITSLQPFHSCLSTLMNLSCIFFPGAQSINSASVRRWLVVWAHCIQQQMDWIKPFHLRLLHCFSVMHQFFPVDLVHSYSLIDQNAYSNFTKNRLFDKNLLHMIGTFAQVPSRFDIKHFKTWENLTHQFRCPQTGNCPLTTFIDVFNNEQNPMIGKTDLSVSLPCAIMTQLAPSHLIRQLLSRFRDDNIDYHFDWVKAIDTYILHDEM